jgi:hypothetical protein
MDCVQRFRGSSIMYGTGIANLCLDSCVWITANPLARKWSQNFSIFAVLHYAMVAKSWQKNGCKVLPFLKSCTTTWLQKPGRKMFEKFCHFCNTALRYGFKTQAEK